MKFSFLKTSQFLTLNSFGLSISQSSIRIAKLTPKNTGYIPAIIEDVPIKESCDFFSNPNEYTECPVLKKTLIELRKKHKIKFAQVAIPEEHTYIFKVAIPSTDIELVHDFIVNNIDQHIPLTAQEIVFDYKILDKVSHDNNLSVVVTAIPEIIIERYTSILESAGIQVTACEPETHAIARCVIDKGDTNPYIIINVDRNSTNISVVENGLVQYTQTISVSINDFYKKTDQDAAATLRDAVNKVIIYWFTSQETGTQEKIENIILTGEGVDKTDLINFLESNLFVNATIANVWTNCFDLYSYVPKVSKTESLKYATSIGLAMYKIK